MKTIAAREHFDEAVTEEVRDKAVKRGRSREHAGLQATGIRYLSDRHAIELSFGDVTAITLPLASYKELVTLTPEELGRLTLGFGGQAVVLEERDLHISLAGMMAANEPIKNIAASLLLKLGGSPGNEPGADTPGSAVLYGGAAMLRRVSLHEKREIQYWTRELGISKEELEEAVKQAGDYLDVVVQLRTAGAE